MGLSKLTSGHIAIIGAVLLVLLGAIFWFVGPYKTKQNLTELDTREQAAQTELAKKTKNQQDLAKAKQEVAQTQAQFAIYDRTLMPQPGIDLTKPADEKAMTLAMLRLWRQPYELVTAANRFAFAQAKRYHVTITPAFSVAGQPTDPAAISPALIELPLGQITVAGSFQNVCDYVKAWDQFHRLVALDGFQLQASPNPAGETPVVGTATLTSYIFPHAPEGAAAGAVPSGGLGGGPGGGGAYPGAPPVYPGPPPPPPGAGGA